jgi:glycosyltransferase involved in cell wall biosynthesis
MSKITLLGIYAENRVDIGNITRRFDKSRPLEERAWTRTSGHIYNSNFTQTLLLYDTLRRLYPDAEIQRVSFYDLHDKYFAGDSDWKPDLSDSDVSIAVIGKYNPDKELDRLSQYADPAKTVIVLVDEWLLSAAYGNPDIIAKLAGYAAVFEHSEIMTIKLQNLGLKNIRYLPIYRIWTDEASVKAKESARSRGGLTKAVVYNGIGSVKGINYAVDAVKKVNEKRVNETEGQPLQLDIFGPNYKTEGDDRAQWLSSLIGGDPNIRYVDELDGDTDIAKLSEYDLAINPTVHGLDTLPTTLIIALAAGLPIIATDIGYSREAVRDGVNGYLVPPGDSDAIANKIESLLSDSETLKKFAKASQAIHSAVFSEEAAASRLAGTLDKFIKR